MRQAAGVLSSCLCWMTVNLTYAMIWINPTPITEKDFSRNTRQHNTCRQARSPLINVSDLGSRELVRRFLKNIPVHPQFSTVADRALDLQLLLQPMDKVRPYSPSLSLAVALTALWIYPNSLSSIRVRFLTYVEMLERLMRRLE